MRRSSVATGLAVVLALAGTSGALGAGISRASASACGSLSRGPGASVDGSELQDVTILSASQAWAVGDVFDTRTRQNRTLVERYDGSGWSRVPSPNQSAGNSGPPRPARRGLEADRPRAPVRQGVNAAHRLPRRRPVAQR